MSTLDLATLQKELETENLNREIWANSIVQQKRRKGKDIPVKVNLASAITDVLPESHIKGADVVKVEIDDPTFELLAANYFDADEDGKLDSIEVNYPRGTKWWWRLSTLSPKDDGTIELTFIDRHAARLMETYGPYKANRNSMTRAEFLKLVDSHVPGGHFHSEQLHKKQPIDPAQISAPSPSSKNTIGPTDTQGAKTVGLGNNTKSLTVKGKPMTSAQAGIANILLNEAHRKGANEAATVALIYAGIWESSLNENADNGSYWGVLSAAHSNVAQHDTVGMADAFLDGGKGFTSALQLSKNISNPVQIAVMTEKPSVWPDNAYSKQSGYPGDAKATAEAKAIVTKGGGAAGGGSIGPGTTLEVIQPYNFEIGTADNVRESLWDGMQRLAQEVNWELFTDGPDVYYDSDMTLIKQKVSAVIHRGDAFVNTWNYDWNNRQVCTQFTLNLICDPFEFRAGEVIELQGFGVDNASTAKLPGRWLISDIVKQQESPICQLTLIQPTKPKNEPSPQVTQETTDQSIGGIAITPTGAGGVDDAAAAAQELSAMKVPYIWGGGHGSGQLDDKNPRGFDCSGSVCWVLHKAGMWPSSAAATSGTLAASWGQPGQGKQMTVWANGDHTFIEFKLPQGHFQLNTSYGSANGLPPNPKQASTPGASGPGPQFFDWGQNGASDAAGGGFTPRHWPGT